MPRAAQITPSGETTGNCAGDQVGVQIGGHVHWDQLALRLRIVARQGRRPSDEVGLSRRPGKMVLSASRRMEPP
jgi:hypothetical protein